MTSSPENYAEPVCVAIASADIAEDEVRRLLSAELPLRVARWEDRGYLPIIRGLRPRVIVVVTRSEQLADDSAALIAALFARFGPTVVSATVAGSDDGELQLVVHQLGTSTRVRIHRLNDLQLS